MITTLVRFKLLKSRQETIEIYKRNAPKYLDVPGLLRKHYVLTDDDHGGAVYLWASREAAEKLYDDEWKRTMRERYGTDPVITYFVTPVVVDTATGKVTSDL
jgi:hypothetical protein